MVKVNEDMYIERTVHSKKNPNSKSTKRDWWLVTSFINDKYGRVSLYEVFFDKKFIGKRVKFKIECLK